jgi:hypothetical protein
MSSETLPTSSDGTFGVGNVKVEGDRDMQEGEGVYSEEEEERLDIQGEVCLEDTV